MAFPWMMLAQMGIGAVQSAISASKASELPDPEQYSVSPELRGAFNEARTRSQQGYSPAERAAFNQMLARQATASKQMFRNVGMSGAGAAAANIMSVDALNQFAAGSEAARRQNFGQYAGLASEIQGVRNMEVGRQNQRLLMEEQALGGGIQAGISNMFQGLNAGQNMDWMNKAMETYKGQGGGASGGVSIPSMLNSGTSGGGAMNTPSPLWNSFETQGFPFLPADQQGGFNFFGFGQ
jgi:hypothetical protein